MTLLRARERGWRFARRRPLDESHVPWQSTTRHRVPPRARSRACRARGRITPSVARHARSAVLRENAAAAPDCCLFHVSILRRSCALTNSANASRAASASGPVASIVNCVPSTAASVRMAKMLLPSTRSPSLITSIFDWILAGQFDEHIGRPRVQPLRIGDDDGSSQGAISHSANSIHFASACDGSLPAAATSLARSSPAASRLHAAAYETKPLLSASSNSCRMSSAVVACFRNLQNVSSRSWREMFSNARRWSPGRSGGEISRKNKLHLLAVEAVEIDAFAADGHGAHQAFDAGVLGVRHGDAAADAGAAQLLALQDRLDDALDFVGRDFSGFEQRPDHLANGAFLVVGRQLARIASLLTKSPNFIPSFPFSPCLTPRH